MLKPTMLYKLGGNKLIWDIPLHTIIVDEHEVDGFLAEGWFTHPFDARDSAGQAVKLETVAVEAEHPGQPEPSQPSAPRRGRPPKVKE